MSKGIMFHHFHNEKHLPSQGSIDSRTFEKMIDYLQSKFCLLDANEYLDKAKRNNLKKNDICLTFDDSLLCQYDIALPILNKKRISAFFFIYTSIFTKKPDYLEIYRYFRTSLFNNIDDFYEIFFSKVEKIFKEKYIEKFLFFDSSRFLSDCPFYTHNDKWFRFLRDYFLDKNTYDFIYEEMMREFNFDINSAIHILWMNEIQIKEISNKGHIVGLHSHSHPTQLEKLLYKDQEKEYAQNLYYLEKIIGKGKVSSVSHPCGSYNKNTLKILDKLGIKLGFRASMIMQEINSLLEIPREDHAIILKEMHN